MRLLETEAARSFLGVHVHEGVAWFNKERFEALVVGLSAVAEIAHTDAVAVLRAAATSGYKLEALVIALRAA